PNLVFKEIADFSLAIRLWLQLSSDSYSSIEKMRCEVEPVTKGRRSQRACARTDSFSESPASSGAAFRGHAQRRSPKHQNTIDLSCCALVVARPKCFGQSET